MTNVIKIKDLKKYFSKTHAVDGVSFEVKKGEVFGFLGPNGAGKSTTIRCLMDFLTPTEGEITILGLDSRRESVAIKEKVGYLPGNVKLYDKWTGWDHIRFVEGIRGKSKNVDELIAKLDFNPNKKFKQLSSGNKQKLGLILALMSDPQVLIMDEPTVGLDPLLQNAIYEILIEMKHAGKTILISSHNLPEVERLCDRVGIIKDGKMVAVETLKEISKMRLHKFEVRFNEEVKAADFQFDGVENLVELPDGLTFSVGGDIGAVLKRLAKYKVADISVSHADLEEVFLKFYERKK